jgi:hypothetical protein
MSDRIRDALKLSRKGKMNDLRAVMRDHLNQTGSVQSSIEGISRAYAAYIGKLQNACRRLEAGFKSERDRTEMHASLMQANELMEQCKRLAEKLAGQIAKQ